jgi:hypothetical protein
LAERNLVGILESLGSLESTNIKEYQENFHQGLSHVIHHQEWLHADDLW